MQLVLTADRRFWGENRNVLFLGEWCKLHSEREVWAALSAETLPYHWDDRKRYAEDSQYTAQVSEQCLESLTNALNRLHGTAYGREDWRLVLGPWLNAFTAVLYDRFLSIQSAIEKGGIGEVCIESRASHEGPVADTHRFFCGVLSDRYNLHLYSELVRELGRFPIREIAVPADLSLSTHPLDNPSYLKRLGKRIARVWSRGWSRCSPGHVFISSYIPRPALLSLQWKLRQMPTPDFYPEISGQWSENPTLRSELSVQLELDSDSKFTEVLARILVREIPRVFVEGFPDLERAASANFPLRAKSIFTANAHVHHEAFKLWAVHRRAEGSPLIISQHGGQTGVGKWCQADAHDQRIADYYFSWGWAHSGTPKVQPHPSPKLAKFRASARSAGEILLVMNGFPRYFYRAYSVPVAGQVLAYLSDQVRFIKQLDPAFRNILKIRPYFIDYGWDEAARLREELPDLQFSRGTTFAEDLCAARLFIGNHNTTTFLETMSADFPTLLFWNPEHWELHPEVVADWERLREAGIFFSEPREAATRVNEIGNDPEGWWRTERVQSARRKFCDRFAKTDVHWKTEWTRALRKLEGNASLQRSELNLSFLHGVKRGV